MTEREREGERERERAGGGEKEAECVFLFLSSSSDSWFFPFFFSPGRVPKKKRNACFSVLLDSSFGVTMRGEISFVLRSSTYGGKKKRGKAKRGRRTKRRKKKKKHRHFFCSLFVFSFPRSSTTCFYTSRLPGKKRHQPWTPPTSPRPCETSSRRSSRRSSRCAGSTPRTCSIGGACSALSPRGGRATRAWRRTSTLPSGAWW